MAMTMAIVVKILIIMMMVNNARPSSTLLGKLIKGERGNDETRQWQADLKAFVLEELREIVNFSHQMNYKTEAFLHNPSKMSQIISDQSHPNRTYFCSAMSEITLSKVE